jgi:putative membrane protein
MSLPPFHVHLDVLALIGALAGGYWLALRRLGPRLAGTGQAPAGEAVATRRQVVSYSLGVLAVAAAAMWPIHDLSEHYLFSVHMFQHLLLSLVAPGLMLFGTPAWLLRWLLRPRAIRRVAAQLTRPFFAMVLFNAVIVITHWPAWVDLTLRSELFHFASHALLFGSAVCMWWPVVSPLPEMPSLTYPARMVYLFLQSLVPTVPAAFLTFGSTPLYRAYVEFPRIWGWDVLTDQRVAGLLMKLLGAAILWAVMTVIFFRWFTQEQRTEGWDALEWGRTERDIRTGLNQPPEAIHR